MAKEKKSAAEKAAQKIEEEVRQRLRPIKIFLALTTLVIIGSTAIIATSPQVQTALIDAIKPTELIARDIEDNYRAGRALFNALKSYDSNQAGAPVSQSTGEATRTRQRTDSSAQIADWQSILNNPEFSQRLWETFATHMEEVYGNQGVGASYTALVQHLRRTQEAVTVVDVVTPPNGSDPLYYRNCDASFDPTAIQAVLVKPTWFKSVSPEPLQRYQCQQAGAFPRLSIRLDAQTGSATDVELVAVVEDEAAKRPYVMVSCPVAENQLRFPNGSGRSCFTRGEAAMRIAFISE